MKNINIDDVLQYIKSNKDYFSEKFHLTKMGVFGSFSRGEESENSDIDILIEFEEQTENIYQLKYELRELFSKEFDRKINLAREKYLKPRIKQMIIDEAILCKII